MSLSNEAANTEYTPLESHEIEEARPSKASYRHHRNFQGPLWGFCGAVVTLLVLLVSGLLDVSRMGATSRETISPFPDVPIETVAFTKHDIYMAPPSSESDAAWDSLNKPFNSGLLPVEDSKLPPPLPTASDDIQLYGVSMFHQLHCLQKIRNSYWDFFTQLNKTEIKSSSRFRKPRGMHHIMHCFDFIRQGIQCAGDLTVEWANTTGPGRPHVDGLGVTHECKSFDFAADYMKRNGHNISVSVRALDNIG